MGATIDWAASGRSALDAIANRAVDLLLVDEDLGDMTGLALVEKVVTVNAMINCALVSSLPEKTFHEASEGLGIVMRLPPSPPAADGTRLMAQLNRILGFTTPTEP
jgi:CheY-like chemotaxis protein